MILPSSVAPLVVGSDDASKLLVAQGVGCGVGGEVCTGSLAVPHHTWHSMALDNAAVTAAINQQSIALQQVTVRWC